MASGDASRTWFSEMIETLRQEWNSEMSWEQVFTLRDRLDAMLEEIRTSRNIRPPSMWCPVCNQRTQQAPPSVSVRATILALGRFGIVAAAEIKSLEKRWAKHRKENSLDRNGKLIEALSTASAAHGQIVSRTTLPYDGTSTSEKSAHKRETGKPLSVGEEITRGTSERGPR